MRQGKSQRNKRRPNSTEKKNAIKKSSRITALKRTYISHTANFSDIEGSLAAFRQIQKLVSQAGLAAASEAKAVGLPKIYARNNEIIREYADGRIEVIVSSKGNKNKTYFRRLNPRILHARKK